MKRKLDPYTLRWVARWHRRQFKLSTFPSAWEAHLISANHWREKAKALTKPPRRRSKRA